jgi:predicted RNA-binding Zn-ribbon protein involved in translation (DUF1610 family)
VSKSRRNIFTTTPDPAAPHLVCPNCDATLVYDQTIVGGVRPPERWDLFTCPSCGPFEYRHRTGRLRAGRGTRSKGGTR